MQKVRLLVLQILSKINSSSPITGNNCKGRFVLEIQKPEEMIESYRDPDERKRRRLNFDSNEITNCSNYKVLKVEQRAHICDQQVNMIIFLKIMKFKATVYF